MSIDPRESIVTAQYVSGKALIQYLTEQRQLDLLGDAENNFRKVMLLSVASYFEKEILQIVLKCAELHSNELITSLVKSKAIEGQYFKYFDWGGRNVNGFFSLFGPEFKSRMERKVREDLKFEEAIKNFLQLGRDRNYLVHRNFAEYPIETTAEEINGMFFSAAYFVQLLHDELLNDQP